MIEDRMEYPDEIFDMIDTDTEWTDLHIPWYFNFYYSVAAIVWRWYFIVTRFRKPTFGDILKHVY